MEEARIDFLSQIGWDFARLEFEDIKFKSEGVIWLIRKAS